MKHWLPFRETRWSFSIPANSGAYVAEYPLDQRVEQTLYDPSQFYLTSTHIDETAKETSVGTHFHGRFTSDLLTYLDWDHEGTTQVSVYLDSLIEKVPYDVEGEITDLSSLDKIITLRDLEDAAVPQWAQEAQRTAGPERHHTSEQALGYLHLFHILNLITEDSGHFELEVLCMLYHLPFEILDILLSIRGFEKIIGPLEDLDITLLNFLFLFLFPLKNIFNRLSDTLWCNTGASR